MWGRYIAMIIAEDRPTIRAMKPTTWIKSTNGDAVDKCAGMAVSATPETTIHARISDRLVKRVLITGVSGSGKSSVIQELAARGYKAIDTDWDPGWERISGEAHPGILGSDWIWREDTIQDLLNTEDADILFVSACVPNQGKFYDQFRSPSSTHRP